MTGIEPVTSPYKEVLYPEPSATRAGDETRTATYNELSLYQLSYAHCIHLSGGQVRTCEDISQQIYSLPQGRFGIPPYAIIKKNTFFDIYKPKGLQKYNLFYFIQILRKILFKSFFIYLDIHKN